MKRESKNILWNLLIFLTRSRFVTNAIERAILSEDGILQPYDVEIAPMRFSDEAGIATLTFENDIYYIPNVPTKIKQL